MVDLHTHSSCSDGSLSPAALVDRSHAAGLSALALTDHDILHGIPEAQSRADEIGLRFIPGVEIEIESSTGTFHLLGLNLGGNTDPLEARLAVIRERRAARNETIARKMRDHGINATPYDFKSFAKGDVVSRLHIARFLISRGVAKSVKEAFQRFLSPGKPFFEPKESMQFEEGVSLIHTAGGFAIMAHPYSLKLKKKALEKEILRYRERGLDGIEAFHSDYAPPDCLVLETFGRTHGLLVTAGSDYHGDSWPERRLGYTAGGRPIEDRYLPF